MKNIVEALKNIKKAEENLDSTSIDNDNIPEAAAFLNMAIESLQLLIRQRS